MPSNTQFSIAVHMMAGLAMREGEETTSASLADSVNTSRSFVRRTLAKLSKAGLVTTVTGRRGSCRLSKDPRRISLLAIYRAVEAPAAFAIHAYEPHTACQVSCKIKPALGNVLAKTQSAFEKTLAKIELADVIADLRRP